MKPYTFMYGAVPWPADITTLQLYAPVCLEENPELAVLIGQWRQALADAPIRLVEDRWLHVTLEMISDAPAGDIDAGERAALAEAVREALSGTPVYEGRAGSALAYESGALIDISPAAPLVAVHQALRQAVHAVRGPDSTGYRVPKPHLSLGYATAEADSDPWQRALRRVDPNGAPLRLTQVDLVEVGVDQTAGQLWWDQVASVPLHVD
ncbi:2'-5' RNA ligase family protein [Kutzneria buriramensis]|uniref:2'-5' RNA ligase n=1 Tax=Kutzneria buriramensis TaxID=1045776 RepID=A0A3E0G5Y4_9PSEU|nr:2'-5' RNA ligase family protein [Kutzneria buriramensis]REH18317.1 2'-5' RNA ligase [Kutzneria buriramensis]